MKKHLGTLLTGVALGGLLTTGATVVASGVIAEKSTLPFYLNGKPVQVDAYLIGQNNYFKLRDIAALADFGVTWDPETGSVYIDTTVGYTPEPTVPGEIKESPKTEVPDSTTTDYSTQANPAVFAGEYTRELYNAFREAILSGASTAFDKAVVSPDPEWPDTMFWKVEGAAASYRDLNIRHENGKALIYTRETLERDKEAKVSLQPFLEQISGMSDRDKLRAAANLICDRLEYSDQKNTWPYDIFAQEGIHYGSCMSYSHAFEYLCTLMDIPCILVHSEIHQWNEVFVDGTWYSVDLSNYDISYSTGNPRTLLFDLDYLQGSIFLQTEPELTIFAKELLVPGSTQ